MWPLGKPTHLGKPTPLGSPVDGPVIRGTLNDGPEVVSLLQDAVSLMVMPVDPAF